MRQIFILLIFSFKLVSQNDSPIFEFNTRFIDQACSFKELTNDIFQEERKFHKIKCIRISVAGKSLDSLYDVNRDFFQNEINNYSINHTPYSFIKVYNYDKQGFLIGYFHYPTCKYLTKEDSLKINKLYYKYSNKEDTAIICKYFNDSLNEKIIHVKGEMLKKITKQPELIKIQDSTKTGYTYRTKGYRFTETNYQYYPNRKLKSISSENKPDADYEWHFEYPTKNKILITSVEYNPIYDTIFTYQNIIIKDKSNKILRSILFEKSKPIHKSIYTMHYDKMNYLTSIDRREKYDDVYDIKNTYFTFKNYYNKSKLIKTIAHYNFNVVENDIIYDFDYKGLIKSVQQKKYKEIFEYEFYEN